HPDAAPLERQAAAVAPDPDVAGPHAPELRQHAALAAEEAARDGVVGAGAAPGVAGPGQDARVGGPAEPVPGRRRNGARAPSAPARRSRPPSQTPRPVRAATLPSRGRPDTARWLVRSGGKEDTKMRTYSLPVRRILLSALLAATTSCVTSGIANARTPLQNQ